MSEDKLVEAGARAICELYGQSPSFNWRKHEGAVRAALAAIEREGWKVVPVEPTEEMIEAGLPHLYRYHPDRGVNAEETVLRILRSVLNVGRAPVRRRQDGIAPI
jgi:hypothetical protein